MRKDAWTNGQDILNWYKTPNEMKFTEKGFPILEPLKDFQYPRRGIRLLPFNFAMSNKDTDYFIHFFLQDYQFNRIWNSPSKYIDILKRYKGIIMPDFSLYSDMPEPLQMFNHYRNLWFARMCQINGITVIPSANWSLDNSFDYCFEGFPTSDIIMVSSVGSMREKNVVPSFLKGFEKMTEKLNPKLVIVRGVESSYKELSNKFNNLVFLDYRKEKK